ncbi:unnamed protein product, partial [Ixodes persulcatus]
VGPKGVPSVRTGLSALWGVVAFDYQNVWFTFVAFLAESLNPKCNQLTFLNLRYVLPWFEPIKPGTRGYQDHVLISRFYSCCKGFD